MKNSEKNSAREQTDYFLEIFYKIWKKSIAFFSKLLYNVYDPNNQIGKNTDGGTLEC